MRTARVLAATVMIFSPVLASAQSTAPGNGQYNGKGYWHSTGPDPTSVGQPNQDCEQLIADSLGADPGNSASSGHSAFGGSAGDVYAGSQPQNSRNSVSVSQYDVACSNQQPQ